MLIIFEGVDGAGKTTMAEYITERLREHKPTELLHRGPIEFDPLVEYELALDDYRPGFGKHIVCDRWHWGEDVYGPMYRGKTELNRASRLHIEMFLQARGACMVLATQSRTEIHRRLDDRGETFLKPHDRNAVVEAYYDVAYRSSLNSFVVSSLNDEEWYPLAEYAVMMEKVASDLNVYSTYVGPRGPRYLVLGERRNPLKSGGHSSAFVPYAGTSGRYLLEHLPEDVARTCGIANAMEEDVHALWCTLGHPLVVALGRMAHDRCELIELPHGAAPHPQYVRRFHNDAGEEYGRVIREAALHRLDLLGWRP